MERDCSFNHKPCSFEVFLNTYPQRDGRQFVVSVRSHETGGFQYLELDKEAAFELAVELLNKIADKEIMR